MLYLANKNTYYQIQMSLKIKMNVLSPGVPREPSRGYYNKASPGHSSEGTTRSVSACRNDVLCVHAR